MSKQLDNKKWEQYKNGNEDVIENFCGACLAIPLAFAGIGASAYGSSSRGAYQQQKKWALWSGITITLISILVAIYYLFIKKCVDCGYTD